MNRKALQKLSYGVYLVTTSYNGKPYGCVANSAMQITSAPAQIACQVFLNILLIRMVQLPLHGQHIHNQAGTAEAALVCPFLCQKHTGLFRFLLKALQRCHRTLFRAGRQHRTGQHRLPLQEYGTQPAV